MNILLLPSRTHLPCGRNATVTPVPPVVPFGDHSGRESLAAEFKLRSKGYRVQPPPSLTVKLGGGVQICDRGDSGCLLSRREAYPEAPHVLVVEIAILKARVLV